jgi:putative autotransporter adhesin-like protein
MNQCYLKPCHANPLRPLAASTMLAATLSVATLGASTAAERELGLAGFNGIDVQVGLRAVVSRTDGYSVRILADDEDTIDEIEAVVDGTILRIGRKQSFFDFLFDGGVLGFFFSQAEQPEIQISAPDLSTLIAGAGASIELDATTVPVVEIFAASGARISVGALEVGDLRVSASSGGRVDLTGTCVNAEVEFSSGGTVSAENLACGRASVTGSSGASATIAIAEEVTGSVSSGASLVLAGTPAAIDVSASSGGSVRVR